VCCQWDFWDYKMWEDINVDQFIDCFEKKTEVRTIAEAINGHKWS